MNLSCIPLPAFEDNYIWVLVNQQQKLALVVDPGTAIPVINYLRAQDLILTGILVTHHHHDHVGGILELLDYQTAAVYGPANSKIAGINNFVAEGEILHLNFFGTYHIMAIPGHTLDHVAYYTPGAIFCGDTLFAAGCGRLFEGSAEQLYNSLQKIMQLPDDTKIYCAHEYTLSNLYFAQMLEPSNPQIMERLQQVQQLRSKNLPTLPSTLASEKATNPFLRCDAPEIVQHVSQFSGRNLNTQLEVFSAMRKWKSQ